MHLKGLAILIFAIAVTVLLILNRGQLRSSNDQFPSVHSETSAEQSQLLTIGDTYYLFDVVDNGPEKLQKLLQRAEYLSKQANETDKKLTIAMVIHGPDMDIFDKKYYKKQKKLVDTAARLDADGVIDFKICQTTARSRGIKESSFPAFMEMVPFAPDEINHLEAEGYVRF